MSTTISAGRLVAIQAAPYYSHALLSLVPVVVPTGTLAAAVGSIASPEGTLATTEDMVLVIEQGALDRMSVKELGAAFIHEVSHLLRKHLQRTSAGRRNPQLANIAQDLEINDDVEAMGFKPAEWGWCLPASFQLPNGKNWEWYYQELLKKVPPPPKGCGTGLCGGCAGNPRPGERGAVPPGVRGRSKAEVAAVSAATAQKVREHAKTRGRLPNNIARWAELHGAPPEVPWEQRLARACRRAVSYRPGAVTTRYHRPSRRQAGLGYGPGRAVLPAVVCPVPQVAVMIDTSGSMGAAALSSALRETDGVLKAVGARVTLCVVDAEVHALQEVATVQQALKLLKGGGGTVFDEAFARLERRRPRPEVIVCMTDGYAGVPAHCPTGIKVVWALIGGNEQPPANWGEVVVVS